MGPSLGPDPDSVLEPGLKVPIVCWCSLCQDPETEAIPAVSRRYPLGLSLNWGGCLLLAESRMGGIEKEVNIPGLGAPLCPFIFSLRSR